jgi:hypothetical protein
MELLRGDVKNFYDLLAAGYNQTEIGQILKVSDHIVINRMLHIL